jgi:hypothetical protein
MVGRVEQPPSNLAALARHVAVVGYSGLITGVLVGGLGSRVFMRISGATGRASAQGATTEAGFTVGEITLDGSMGLVLFVGIFMGILAALLYAVFRPWLAWAGRLRGVVFGAVLFAIGSASSDVMNPDNIDFFILGNGLVNVLVIGGLFLAFGIVMEEAHRWLERKVPGESGRIRVGSAMLAVVGTLAAVPLTISIMFGNSCDCDPPIIAAWFVVLTGIGTVLWWVSARRPRLRLPAAVIGYAGLIGATGFGLVRAISDAAEIIG